MIKLLPVEVCYKKWWAYVVLLIQVYLSREKRSDHEHNKKAGAMNAVVKIKRHRLARFYLPFLCMHVDETSQVVNIAEACICGMHLTT